MAEMLSSIRHAARSLARTPGFTAIAVLTLVLGIGANTAIFSAIEAILLHPLPVPSADRVVFVTTRLAKTASDINVLTPAEFQELAERKDLFAGVGAYNPATVTVTGTGEPERVDAISTAGALFGVLGVKPFLGRLYDSTDILANRRVAMLSYAYWLRRTGGSAGHDVLGSSITLDDTVYTVVGVLPRGFDFPHDVGIWSPRQLRPVPCAKLDRDRRDPLSHNCKFATTVARLRDGVEMQQVQTKLDALMTQWRRTMPQFYPEGNRANVAREAAHDRHRRRNAPSVAAALRRIRIRSVDRLCQRRVPPARAHEWARSRDRAARGAGCFSRKRGDARACRDYRHCALWRRGRHHRRRVSRRRNEARVHDAANRPRRAAVQSDRRRVRACCDDADDNSLWHRADAPCDGGRRRRRVARWRRTQCVSKRTTHAFSLRRRGRPSCCGADTRRRLRGRGAKLRAPDVCGSGISRRRTCHDAPHVAVGSIPRICEGARICI